MKQIQGHKEEGRNRVSPTRMRKENPLWWTKRSCSCLGLLWKACFGTDTSKLWGLQGEATAYKVKGWK